MFFLLLLVPGKRLIGLGILAMILLIGSYVIWFLSRLQW